jgi:rRNA biogenesis protein RRP5
MSTPFPRGGKQELTPLELREVNEKAKRELFEEEPVATKKRKLGAEIPRPKKVKQQSFSLSHKRLQNGMTLLGVIKQINELDIEIQLPNQLVGFCSITEISDELTRLVEIAAEDDSEEDVPDLNDYFRVGQPVVVGIISLDNKRVDLTLHPSKLNKTAVVGMHLSAQVKSVEDHGYLLDLGLEKGGFLLKKEQPEECNFD